jgi:hypothetical protein
MWRERERERVHNIQRDNQEIRPPFKHAKQNLDRRMLPAVAPVPHEKHGERKENKGNVVISMAL